MAVRPGAQLIAFVRLGRPLFLAGGFLFHALGVMMALYQGHSLNLTALILGQVVITSTQLMTHYANDYFDLDSDRPNRNLTPWSGGSRVLPDGQLSPRVALLAARALMGIALAGMVAIAIVVHPPAGAIGLMLAGLALSWFYSAPPIRLVERGLGELAGALIVPALVTCCGLLLQGGRIGMRQALVIAPLILLQFVMLLDVAFPDAESDAETGKGTLVVRLGGESAALLHTLIVVAAMLAMLLGAVLIIVRSDLTLGVWLLGAWILTLPVGLWHGSRVASGAWCDPLQWGDVAFWGIALLVMMGGLDVVAFGLVTLHGGIG